MCTSTLGVSQPINTYIVLSVQREKTAIYGEVIINSQHFNSFVRFYFMISITFFNATRILRNPVRRDLIRCVMCLVI